MMLAALLLCVSSLHGCDSAPDTSARPAAASRRPDFQEGPFTLYYTSQSAADVVFNGVTYRIGSDAGPQDMPFSYDWEDDGDVDLHFNGATYEVEHPLDALDDALDSFKKHRAKPSPKAAPPALGVKSAIVARAAAPDKKPQMKSSAPASSRKPQAAASLKPVSSSSAKQSKRQF